MQHVGLLSQRVRLWVSVCVNAIWEEKFKYSSTYQ